MRTQVAEQSIEAYHKHVKSGEKLKQREAILAALRNNNEPMTRRQLAKYLDFELGATAGRVNKLIDDGLLEACGYIKCNVTNRTVGLVRLAGGVK